MESGLVVDRIKERMSLAGITSARQLADKSGVDNVSISKILGDGRPQVTVATVAKIADALECSIDYLMGKSDTPLVAGRPLPEHGDELLKLLDNLSLERRDDLLAVAKVFVERDRGNADLDAKFARLATIAEERSEAGEFDKEIAALLRAVSSGDASAIEDYIARFGLTEFAPHEKPKQK